MEREVQCVVQVVIKVRAGADEKVDKPAFHQLDNTAAQTGRCHRSGYRQTDRRIVRGVEHPVGEDVTRFRQPASIEGLEPVVDQVSDLGAAPWAVVTDGRTAQVTVVRGIRCSGGTMRHGR